MWYEGPTFPWESESSWKKHHAIKENDTNDTEIKKEVFVNRMDEKTEVLKFRTNLLRKAFPKRDKTELPQQIGTSEHISKYC